MKDIPLSIKILGLDSIGAIISMFIYIIYQTKLTQYIFSTTIVLLIPLCIICIKNMFRPSKITLQTFKNYTIKEATEYYNNKEYGKSLVFFMVYPIMIVAIICLILLIPCLYL